MPRPDPDILKSQYRAVFGSANGRAVLADVLAQSGLFAENYLAGDAELKNPAVFAFVEGKRRIALAILGNALGGTEAMIEHMADAVGRVHAPPPSTGPRPAITENKGLMHDER